MFSLKLFQTHFKISPIYSSSFYFTITKPKSPLFVRLGGESSLLRVLDIFDTKIRNDSVLKSYFTNSSLSKIHEHQKKTLTIAFGDPSGYTSRDIKSFHSSMHIKESDWRIYLEHLKESLSQLNLPKDAIAEALANLDKYQKCIIEKTIYEKLIQPESLMKDVVSTLYDKLLTDKETRDFFLGVDLQKVKLHEAQYLLNLIGGSVKYEGREIKIAHKPINLTDRHFYIYKKHINDALRYHKVDSDIIDQILFLIEKKRTELMDRKTPYEIVGGAYGVRRIVDRMYEMIPNHPSLKHYFEDMNIEAIKAAQMKFISSILDGPAYIGKDMKTIHGKMNLADGHFDAFKGCFEIALVEMNLKKDEIRDCTYALEKYRRDVCSISLFELLGGEHTVQKVAKAMAAKVRQNDILKGFYTYGDDDEVRATLRSEIMHALGGPLSFRERDIKSAHQGMFLKMEHFNEYKKLINESMKENGVVDNLIVQVIKILENKAYLIIDKKNPEDLKKQAVI